MADDTASMSNDDQVGSALSVAYLLALDDTAFIKCAYRTLFKRPVDPSSQHYYLARLQQGISKQQVLIELRSSAEGKRTNVDIAGLNQITMQPAASVVDLLLLVDERFVRGAFLTLLGREPDTGGGDYYLKRLRSGISKAEILAELADSDEARVKAVDLPGLAEILRRYRRFKLPIIGHTLRKWFAPEEASLVHARLRALENRLTVLDEELRTSTKFIENAVVEVDARLRAEENRRVNWTAKLNDAVAPREKKRKDEQETQEKRSSRRESMLRLTARGKEIHREIGRAVEARKNDKRIEDEKAKNAGVINANRD